MQENPKPPSPMRQAAHATGYWSLATTGLSLAGATATAEAAGAGHMVFAVGAVGSLLTMVTAMAVHGSDMLRCSRCMHQVAQSLQEQHALSDENGLESTETAPTLEELWPPASGVVPANFRWAFA